MKIDDGYKDPMDPCNSPSNQSNAKKLPTKAHSIIEN